MQQLFGASAHWAWFILAVGLAIVEMLAPGIFFLWLAVAAVLTGAVALVIDLPWQAQFVLFAVLSVASILAGRAWVRAHPIESDEPTLNRRGQAYVGRVFVLSEAIENGTGRMRVEDTVWKVAGPDLPQGARVRVVSVDGATLNVAPAPTA